jgi:5-hydroxyisourate hydrolase-like protein (transthyretin family)
VQPRHTSRAAVAALTLAVFGLMLAGLVSPAQAAAATGKVKGVVTLAGKPVKNAKVQLYRNTDSDPGGDGDEGVFVRVKTVHTDGKGRYSFSGLKQAYAKKLNYEKKRVQIPIYQYTVVASGQEVVKAARGTKVRPGKTSTMNIATRRAAKIIGSVTRSDGGPSSELTVEAPDDGLYGNEKNHNPDFFPDTKTDVRADGTFVLKGLPAGYYDLEIRGDAYLAQCYDAAAMRLSDCDAPSSQSITLAEGERRVLPPVVATKLAPPVSRLTGKVVNSSGKPLKGIAVSLRTLSGGSIGTPTLTRSSGRFSYAGRLPQGEYVVRYDDPNHVWASQYLGGGPDLSGRTSITVTPGRPVAGLDTKLMSRPTAKIAAKAGTGSAKVAVKITRKASGSGPSGTLKLSYEGISKTVVVSKGRATVTLKGLPAGSRRLVADYSGTSTTAGFSRIVAVTVK